MANYPKKLKDPTEAALSAIQEALNLQDEEQAVSRPVGDSLRQRGKRGCGAGGKRSLRRAHRRSYRRRRGQRRSAIDRPDPASTAAPPGALVLFRRHRFFLRLDRRLRGAVMGLSFRHPYCAWFRPFADRADDRPRRCGFAARHLLLRRRAYGVARAGTAPDRAIDGTSRDAAFRARERGARFHRHRRTGDPPRGRGHGRRRRTGAGARQRARSAGAERSCGARAHLQRQRSPHSRAAPGPRQPARHAGRTGRAGDARRSTTCTSI